MTSKNVRSTKSGSRALPLFVGIDSQQLRVRFLLKESTS